MLYVLGHGSDEVVIELDRLPPSMNVITGQGHWRRFHTEKKTWGGLLAQAIRDSGMGSCRRVTAFGHLTFPDRRKRDQGNYRVLLEKALGDALQDVGVISDDDWDSFSFGDLTYEYVKNVRRTRLLLMPEPRMEDAA